MPTIFKTAGVYRITNTIDGKFYVGSSIDLAARWRSHRYSFKRERLLFRSRLHFAVRKHGAENFIFEILEECEPIKEVILNREQYYIDTLQPDYNLLQTAGSRLGSKSSPETIAKLRLQRHTEEWKQQASERATEFMNRPENKAKYSKLRKGKTFTEIFGERAHQVSAKQSKNRSGKHVGFIPWNKGVPMAISTKQKLSAIGLARAATGWRAWYKGVKTGRPAWNRGRPWSAESRLKMSIAHMGQVPHNKGMRWSDAQKQRMSALKKASFDPVLQQQMTEAARLVNTGKPRSDETKKKIGDAHRGIPSELKGIPRTDEVKQKLSNSLRNSDKAKAFHQDRIGKSRGNNPSGHYGVIRDKARNKWQARIQGKSYGRFERLEDAIAKVNEVQTPRIMK